MEFYGIHLTTILQAAHGISVHGMSLKFIILKLWPHIPGANELNVWNPDHIWNPKKAFHISLTCYILVHVICMFRMNDTFDSQSTQIQ